MSSLAAWTWTSQRHRRIALGLALAFTVTSVVGLGRPAVAAAWDEGAYSSASERELVTLTNRSRAAAGLKALKVDATLRSIARWRSKDMIKRDYFSHDIPGYGSVFDKMSDKGYCYKLAGENIGWNTYPDGDATKAIHEMFMDSSGHRKNILGKKWDRIGIGAYKGADGKKMWTVLFADKCGTSGGGSKSTPKPKPKPKETAKPKAAARSTPKPKPTPKPTPRPTPTPTPVPTPIDPEAFGHRPLEEVDATAPPGGGSAALENVGLRVTDGATGSGLVETIVGGVTGPFFGG
jgi:uncharacterized protein YkwD